MTNIHFCLLFNKSSDLEWHLPATVSKHEEENTEDDAGGANMDANNDAAQRGLSIPALTQTVPTWKQTQHYCGA